MEKHFIEHTDHNGGETRTRLIIDKIERELLLQRMEKAMAGTDAERLQLIAEMKKTLEEH